ncbi:MBL fold metallo-hydrolase [Luteolibacter flavescens]|uniref:MBL fold metallo-hydrolase n=1 Tax=Luteolibacter flavescens TaxID=1859460 RepID=A0ABT3FKJ5_9BACT|nr:MBL fold metallo-hydrolase [Luteolibacter flavescens]MCW1883729.1 MBL fold metallo-hydrolase [Luteolibacter flavescens]
MEDLSRRGFVGTALAGMAALTAKAAAQQPAEPKAFRDPFVYRFKIGELEAFSISDCDLRLGEGLDLMWPVEERPKMKEEMVRHGERAGPLPLYVNILVVRSGSDVLLFDAGFGKGNNPKMGWLQEGLAAVGISPDQVTAGFLSHAHADHLNGFVHQGKPAFPNAVVYLLEEELAFWRADKPDFSKSKRNQNQIPGMIKEVRGHFDTLQEKLRPVKDGTEVLGGLVRIESAPGHTDGHACFRIRSGDAELLHLMDLAHHHLLMFADPNWTIAFDHDPVVAVATRKKYWTEVTGKHTRCYGFHLPWPGLGHIVTEDDGYRWATEAWAWG